MVVMDVGEPRTPCGEYAKRRMSELRFLDRTSQGPITCRRLGGFGHYPSPLGRQRVMGVDDSDRTVRGSGQRGSRGADPSVDAVYKSYRTDTQHGGPPGLLAQCMQRSILQNLDLDLDGLIRRLD